MRVDDATKRRERGSLLRFAGATGGLVAKLVTDKARLVESDGRLVLVLWAYVWVWFGMWLTISPWRLRDWIEWMTASEGRFRLLNSLKLLFGLGVVALGWMGLR